MGFILKNIKLLCRLFGNKSKKEQSMTRVISDRRIEYRTLCLIGEEFVSFHDQIPVSQFLQWLKKEDKKLWSAHKDTISNYSSLSALLSNINDGTANLQEEKRIIDFLKTWNRERRYFFFMKEKKYIVAFNGIDLLKLLYDVNSDEIVPAEISAIENHINVNQCIKICMIGLSFSENENPVLDAIVDKHDKSLTNWKFFSDDNDRAKEYVASKQLKNVQYGTFNTFKAIPPTEVEKTRFKRYDQFREFGEKAETTFTAFCERKERTCRYRDIYNLNICYGSRNGMDDSNIVEVFWGQRAYDNKSKSRTNLVIERGCTMLFQKQSSGLVNVFILPGFTEYDSRVFPGINVYKSLDPARLSDTNFLLRLWNIFVSFTESTSLDGMPSIKQRFVFFYYRVSKKQLLNGELVSSKISVGCSSISKWVLTIGLSGCLISIVNALIQCVDNSSNDNAKQRVVYKECKCQSMKADTLSQKAVKKTPQKKTEKTNMAVGKTKKE